MSLVTGGIYANVRQGGTSKLLGMNGIKKADILKSNLLGCHMF